MNQSNQMLFEDYILNLNLQKREDTVRENTIINYKVAIRQFLTFIGDTPLEDVRTNTAREWLLSLTGRDGGEIKDATRNLKKEAVSSLYKYLISENDLTKNPFEKIVNKKTSIKGRNKNQDTKEILESDEAERLRIVLDENISNQSVRNGVSRENSKIIAYRNKAFVNFMLATGMRVQEVCKLQMRDLDLITYPEQVIVTVVEENSKGKVARDIPISRKVYNDILKYRALIENNSTLVFTSKNGKALATTTINTAIKNLCEQAKIDKNISSHCFRHTFATHMIDVTNNDKLVANLMGHTTTKQINERYHHTTKENKLAICEF